MDRHPLAVSAATGSISSSVLWLLRDIVGGTSTSSVPGLPVDLHCPDCPDWDFPAPTFWVGLLLGFLLWPLLELLVLAKQCVSLGLKAKIAGYSCESRLHRVLG